MKARHSITVG